MNKRKVILCALCVCLIAIIAVGSLAYFTSKDEVTNKFMVAGYDPSNPNPNPDDLFSVSVYETDITDESGSKITFSGNTYEDVAPGDEFKKDPTAKNTGKYDQYVRMNVTFTKAKEWKAILGDKDFTSLLKTVDTSKWECVNETPTIDESTDTVVYSYLLKSKLAPGETAKLFDKVIIPNGIDNTQMASIAEFEIKVGADAIQSDNTGTVKEAFAIYDGLKK